MAPSSTDGDPTARGRGERRQRRRPRGEPHAALVGREQDGNHLIDLSRVPSCIWLFGYSVFSIRFSEFGTRYFIIIIHLILSSNGVFEQCMNFRSTQMFRNCSGHILQAAASKTSKQFIVVCLPKRTF